MIGNEVLVIIPALNEEATVGAVVKSVRHAVPGASILVIDDHSTDATSQRAREAGADLIRVPSERGLGVCLREGYRLALSCNVKYVVRVDADGQHEAQDIPSLVAALVSQRFDAVIGSRFVAGRRWPMPLARLLGVAMFRLLLAPVLGRTVHDPTSGFTGFNRRALRLLADSAPLICPEIGALMTLHRSRLRLKEIPCRMYPRRSGQSSFTVMRSIGYTLSALGRILGNACRFGISLGYLDKHGFEGD